VPVLFRSIGTHLECDVINTHYLHNSIFTQQSFFGMLKFTRKSDPNLEAASSEKLWFLK